MNAIQYKGYTINFSGNGADSHLYVTPGEGFNPDGYGTANTAKGAITKYLKSKNAMHRDDLTVNERAAAKAVVTQAIAETAEISSASERMAAISSKVKASKAATSDSKARTSVSILAKPDPKLQSRNKREGRYVGNLDGLPVRSKDIPGNTLFSCASGYYLPNRKARKRALIDTVNATRQGAFGGIIVNK